MKTRCYLCMFLAVFLFTGIASMGFAQSNTCVVIEKQGSLVTVTCAGEGTKVINMGGSAGIYKPGDPVTITEQTNKDQKVRPRVR